MEAVIAIIAALGAAYFSNFRGFKDYVHSKPPEAPKPVEVAQPVETHVETPKPIDTTEQDKKDAEKFAKEFTVEQFIKFAGQLQSIIEITKLLKDGDIKGVFEKYIKPMDWAIFIKEVYSNSTKFDISLIQSLGKTATAKILGLNVEQVEYHFSALKDEYWTINKGSEIKLEVVNITGVNAMLLKSAVVVELTDHNQAVLQGFHMINQVANEMECKDADIKLVEDNFNNFIMEHMPELHSNTGLPQLCDS